MQYKKFKGEWAKQIQISKEWLRILILLILFTFYVVIWYSIDSLQLSGLTENVFDLGIGMQSGWNYYHYFTWNLLDHYHPILLILSPLFLTGNYNLLLLIQVIFVGLPFIPIYLMALKITKARWISFVISVSYLLNPLTIGMAAFTFHFQIFFPFFFLLGVYLYLAKRYKSSVIVFLISGLFKYQFLAFTALFSIIELILILVGSRRRGMSELHNSELKRNISLLMFQMLASIGLFLGIFISLIHQSGALMSSFDNLQFVISPSNLSNGLIIKGITILVLLSMTGFLIISSRKWLIFLLPYLILLLFSNNYVYQFPDLFGFQYGSLVVPFIYLIIIYGYSEITGEISSRRNKRNKEKISILTRGKVKRILLGIAIIFILLLAGFYQPYSPVHLENYSSISINSETSQSESVYSSVLNEVHLIPRSDPYVVFQNNMPELLPRPYGSDDAPLSMWMSPFVLLNGTMTFLTQNKTGQWTNATIDYVAEDPYSVWFYVTDQLVSYSRPPNTTLVNMYGVVNTLLQSGKYGILAEENGILLLKHMYSGPLLSYKPYTAIIKFEKVSSGNYSSYVSIPSYSLFLSPGTYEINFSTWESNLTFLNNSQLIISYNGQENLIKSFSLANITKQSESGIISLRFIVPNNRQYGNVMLTLKDISYSNNLLLNSFKIVQISSPN